MKLSLKWYRRTVTTFSAIAALVLIVHEPADAAPVAVPSDTLDAIGLVIRFKKAAIDATTKAVKTPAHATIEAEDNKLAARLGIPTTAQNLQSLEGQIGKGDEDDGTLRALIVHAADDGVIDFVVDNGTRYSVPTKEGAEKLAATYGLVFGDVGRKVMLTNVSGSAAQAQLRKGDEVAAINLQPAVNALHAHALFFNAIRDSGSAVVQVGETGYRVPGKASLAAVSRGVAGTGPQIQFPRFLDRGDQPIPESDNKSSSNEVITARVETYYFRDAHRLAQILNRGVKSYQAAAVSQLERAAQNAGESFELARSRRREAEFQAEQKAKQLRQQKEDLRRLVDEFRDRVEAGTKTRSELESQLTALLTRHNAKLAEQQLVRDQVLPQLDADIARLKVTLPAADDTTIPTDEEIQVSIKAKEAERNAANDQLTQIELSLKELNASIATQKQLILELKTSGTDGGTQSPNPETLNSLVTSVKALELEVASATLTARQANEAEELAAKNQFRAEVAAAKADPDTYAPGDMGSVDPVTQVSISVIGEGVLHLRGPRLGVVKIREMINQLDHPIGQVKIGIMTVQLNGEQGHRMENTLRRMEGHLSRGRFLTYVSEQLLKRAIAETATVVAERAMMSMTVDRTGIADRAFNSHQGDYDKLQRWHAYVSAFFGRDFLEGLKDVDPDTPVLDPLNKLLSLSSADSLTLAEAMFVTGLAKHEVREEIVRRFRETLICELPQKDLQWININRINKGWNPLWWGEDCTDPDKVLQHAAENYTFEATTAFFRRDYANERLNPLQREVIRLVQGLALERWLSGQKTELVEQRELVRQLAAADWEEKLSAAESFLVDSEIDRLTAAHLDAQEALRGRKAALDRLIKQIVVAVEDDCYAQFYSPAMERIRRATTEWDVELGSVERTTILTNNRAFGKVAPQATYQFDLPKRDILLAEAMQAAYALHQDLGPLVGDPNFATLTKMFSQQSISGSSVDGTIKNVLPGLDSTTDQRNLLYADSSQPQKFGTQLEKLIPDPAIYKFETGTGFEVRPVVQPDGQSVVFDFNYMYTTDLLEPTSPDERSLGRVKRHFVNTEVQIGNLEWREISRYEISLKAAHNSRGVPLLEDIPVVGLAFRPLPQAKKSIQKNIIIGQAAVYPTVEDLLGLRSPAAAGLPVDEMPQDLERLRNAQKFTNLQVRELLGRRTQRAFSTPSAMNPSVGSTGTGRLALPVPIEQLSYDSPASGPAHAMDESPNPAKPSGSAPARVRPPRPSGN
jgi:hypothetical protein